MKYADLYKAYKEEFPEGIPFMKIKEKENLIDEGHDTLNQCKRYMGMNTLKHCEKVEKYFL